MRRCGHHRELHDRRTGPHRRPGRADRDRPPLRGDGWFNSSGCCAAESQHRAIRLAVDGARYAKPETFAIDWMRLQDGRLFEGDGAAVEDYFAFGAEVHSVAEGTVVGTRNEMPEETPNQPPAAVHVPEDYGGNYVVVEMGEGIWVLYGHLQPGTVTLEVGDQVTTGQVLGLLGNTGNSTAPHPHFGLQDHPEPLIAESLPFVFDEYTHAGNVDPAGPASPTDPVPITAVDEEQTATYPQVFHVVTFP